MKCAKILAMLRSFICAAALAAVVAGCAELPGVEKPLDISYYPEMKVELPPRAKPATESALSDGDLTKSDHVRIGKMYVTHVDEVCFSKESGKDSCNKKDHGMDSAARLLAEAASNGADVVVFGKKNEPDTGSVSVEGKCLKRSPREVTRSVCTTDSSGNQNCGTVVRTVYECTRRESISGTRRGQKSDAILWRFDPELANLVRLTDPMQAAITEGNLAQIGKSIAAGMPVDRADIKGRWPLASAIGAQQYEAAALLLERGADPNENGGASLTLAASQCNRPLLERMIADGGKFGPVAQEALEQAVGRPCPAEYVEYLFEQAPGAKASKSLTALASGQDDPALLALMLKKGGTATTDALVQAAEGANVKQARALLAAGVNPDAWHKKEKFYLVTYLTNRMSRKPDDIDMARLEIIRALLEAGANPDKKAARQYTALAWSVCFKLQFEAAALLIEHGANLNAKLPCKGGTPLGVVEQALTDPSTDDWDRPRYEKLRTIMIKAGARAPS